MANTETWEGGLYIKDRMISKIKLGSGNILYKEKLGEFFNTLRATNQPDRMHLRAFLPSQTFMQIIRDQPPGLAQVTIPREAVRLSQLKDRMRVNETVGVVYTPELKHEAFILLPPISDLIRMVDPSYTDNITANIIYGTYLVDLPERPDFSSIDYDQEETDLAAQDAFSTWRKAYSYFKFPQNLINLIQTSNVSVYGQSANAELLRIAIYNLIENNKMMGSYKPSNSNIVMFDRCGKSMFSRPLKRHKLEYETRIWEYGVADLVNTEMVPPEEIFPKNSGGFVITDTENLIANPGLIPSIVSQVKMLNRNPIVYGQWVFALSSISVPNLNRDVVIPLALALSNNDVSILRTWRDDHENEESITVVNCIQYVAENNYKARQFFVYIDDIGSVPQDIKDQYCGIDFMRSDQLYNEFTGTE